MSLDPKYTKCFRFKYVIFIHQVEFPFVLAVNYDIRASIVISYVYFLVGHYCNECYLFISSSDICWESTMDKAPGQKQCYHSLFSDDRNS